MVKMVQEVSTRSLCVSTVFTVIASSPKQTNLSSEEYERHRKTWSVSLNTAGTNAPMKFRSAFSEAVTKMHRFHR